jgi:hypothetical protein
MYTVDMDFNSMEWSWEKAATNYLIIKTHSPFPQIGNELRSRLSQNIDAYPVLQSTKENASNNIRRASLLCSFSGPVWSFFFFRGHCGHDKAYLIDHP